MYLFNFVFTNSLFLSPSTTSPIDKNNPPSKTQNFNVRFQDLKKYLSNMMFRKESLEDADVMNVSPMSDDDKSLKRRSLNQRPMSRKFKTARVKFMGKRGNVFSLSKSTTKIDELNLIITQEAART